jgi:hypothetical protein
MVAKRFSPSSNHSTRGWLFSLGTIPGIASVVTDNQNPNAATGLAKKKIVGEPLQVRPLVTTDPLVKMLGVISDL